MFDRSKNSMLEPLPRVNPVNQSRKYLRTFLCQRISFCPFSSSPFLAKKDMYKSLSLPSGVDSALRSCVTKREKWLEIHITVPSTINKLRIWYHVFVKQPGLRMTGTAVSRKQEWVMYLGQEILWTQTLLCGKILWREIFRPCNKSDPWFGLKSLLIPDSILLSPEPFPLSLDRSHILGFEPWAHIPRYDPALCHPSPWPRRTRTLILSHTRTFWQIFVFLSRFFAL